MQDYNLSRFTPEERPDILESIFQDFSVEGGPLEFASGIKYEERPFHSGARNLFSKLMENPNQDQTTIIDMGTLREKSLRAYAGVDYSHSEVGNGSKSLVNVYPKSFEELKEGEMNLVLFHEGWHCRDISQGFLLGREKVPLPTPGKFFETLLELRAGFNTYVYFWECLEAGVIPNDSLRPDFVHQNILGEYKSLFFELLKELEIGELHITDREAIRKHLAFYGPQLDPSKI